MARKKLIFVCILAIFIILIVYFVYDYVYNVYYKIDITNYAYNYNSRVEISPDRQHNIVVNILREDENSPVSYILGTTFTKGGADNNSYIDNEKIIFWQRVDTKSIGDKVINGVTVPNWIDVVWLDNNIVELNGITVNINNGYDYRRNVSAP